MFKYFGCEIFYEYGDDIQQKVAKLSHILGILNNACQPTLVQKCPRRKGYNATALIIL
jgi:VanZ family protein